MPQLGEEKPGKMVLPVRIELTTSALPRMRSTTELRQHRPDHRGARGDAALWPPGSSAVKAGCGTCVIPPNFPAMAKADDERAKRLAEALRQNLRRRKAQARGEESKAKPLPDPRRTPS